MKPELELLCVRDAITDRQSTCLIGEGAAEQLLQVSRLKHSRADIRLSNAAEIATDGLGLLLGLSLRLRPHGLRQEGSRHSFPSLVE